MNENDRRPLSSRDTGWARELARQAAARGLTPNAISIASIGCAALAALAFWMAARETAGPAAGWLALAALGCQLRLLCNLIDGMVAIEGGRASATGELWNEWPDRVSDVIVLAAAGAVAGSLALGWAVAAAALMCAYVRELGHRLTGVADFGGWMAKPQRMAAVTVACAVAILARAVGMPIDAPVFRITLAVVLLGTCWTIAVRTGGTLRRLRALSDA